jgi:transcriptional regulator with XRE-family HTH domain
MRTRNRTPPPLRGNRLAEAMLLRGWNKQTALAEALGVKPSAISRWLKSGSLSLDHAVALCDFLDISLDWLMLGRGLPEPGRPSVPERLVARTSESIHVRAQEALAAFTTALPELFSVERGAKCLEETEFHAKPGEPSVDRAAASIVTAGVIEVALPNGRVLRLSERLAPAQIARVVDALEGPHR